MQITANTANLLWLDKTCSFSRRKRNERKDVATGRAHHHSQKVGQSHHPKPILGCTVQEDRNAIKKIWMDLLGIRWKASHRFGAHLKEVCEENRQMSSPMTFDLPFLSFRHTVMTANHCKYDACVHSLALYLRIFTSCSRCSLFTHTHINTWHTYIHMYIYMCVCVCQLTTHSFIFLYNFAFLFFAIDLYNRTIFIHTHTHTHVCFWCWSLIFSSLHCYLLSI